MDSVEIVTELAARRTVAPLTQKSCCRLLEIMIEIASLLAEARELLRNLV